MAFADAAQVSTRVANIVRDGGPLEDKWATLVAQKTIDAQQEISAILLGRGYTAPQIETWASQQSVHLDMAAWFILQDMNVLGETIDLARFTYLDRRESIRAASYVPATTAGASIDSDTYDDFGTPVIAQDRGEDATDDGFEIPRTRDLVL